MKTNNSKALITGCGIVEQVVARSMNPNTMSRREQLAFWVLNVVLLIMAVDLGGSFYEHFLIDPVWPENLALIQPENGGINRKIFWIPLHGVITLLLPVALWATWCQRPARRWLLVAIGIYVGMRVWTFAYFVPGALQFESASELTAALADEARTWVRLSIFRLPMVLAIVASTWMATRRLAAVRGG